MLPLPLGDPVGDDGASGAQGGSSLHRFAGTTVGGLYKSNPVDHP